MKLNAKKLRKAKPLPTQLIKIKRNPIYLILDNINDTYNIGSLFRLADAIAAKKSISAGKVNIPPLPEFIKPLSAPKIGCRGKK